MKARRNREQRHLADVRRHRGWFARLSAFFAGLNTTVGRISAIIALTATICSYLYLWFGNSRTTVDFADANGNVIKLYLTNKGPKLKPSYLRKVDLHFVGLRVEDVTLDPRSDADNATRVVVPSGSDGVVVPLTVNRLRAQCREPFIDGSPDRYTRKEIVGHIEDAQAILTVQVQESVDRDGSHHTLSPLRIPATAIKTFIEQNVPKDLPEKTSC